MKKHARSPRGGIIGVLDIGSTKMCCLIARVEDKTPRVIGIGHHASRGIKHGIVTEIEAASQAILTTVHAAEQMAGEQLAEVVVNLSGGFGASRMTRAEINLTGREISDRNMHRVLEQGFRVKEPPERTVIHSVPVGFSIDGSRPIRDPRGMYGHRLAVAMHVVSAESGTVRNLANTLGRCRLEIAALVASPYASGLACLVEDESELGVTLIDMGGGTTTIAVFLDGNLVFTDSVPVGGSHVTHDIARGLSTPIAHAERMKALYGNAIPSSSDERETITVPLVGEEDEGNANHVPKSILVGIIAPRIEETFELVRDRLAAAGFDQAAGRRVVLTGGACQLPGARELAGHVLDKQIRIGRPSPIEGLAEATGGPAFATTSGLIHFALAERAEPAKRGRARAEEPSGLFGRIGSWVRENI